MGEGIAEPSWDFPREEFTTFLFPDVEILEVHGIRWIDGTRQLCKANYDVPTQ